MRLMYCDYCHNRECPNFGTAKGEYCGIIPPDWCPNGHNKAWEESYIEYQKSKGVKDDEIKPCIIEVLEELPSADIVPVVRCKECKYYELNSWANVNGIPLIVAHQICKRWGNGCKTDENGFCFMGEKVTE